MNTKRIEEIQKETAYPDSISVQQALLKVWNECEQGKVVKNNAALQERAKKVKNMFLVYFDGCYDIGAFENTHNTFEMGVCKLEYENETLKIHLRRPGLLIGKGGCIIDALQKYLDCKIEIIEVDLLK